MRSWREYLPDLRIKEISRKHLNGFIADRQEKGRSPRSLNFSESLREQAPKSFASR
jgi:hypothetical protein